jgi:aminoglycoside 3-N-acetyltransferase I
VLPKFEQARSELYIYDLALDAAHRRQGVATALIGELRRVVSGRGVWSSSYTRTTETKPRSVLYAKLGAREDIMHFDISPAQRGT